MKPSARASSVHLCVVQPAGYVHSMGLLDAALYFRHQFQQLGADVTVAKNRLRTDAPNLVIGAHLGFDPNLTRTFCCLFVNLEQLGPGGSRMPAPYLELLRSSHVIDYDAANPEAYARRSEDVPLICFGYAPYLARGANAVPLDQRPFDLLFFGSMNPRRQQLIERIERTGRTVVLFDAPVYGPERDAFIVQSRAVLNCHHYDSAIFEQVRAFQVLSLGTPLVSERTARTHPGSAYESAVNWFSDDTLERFFTDEYPRREFAHRAEVQLQAFRNCDPRAEYARALDFARAAYGAARSLGQTPACPQRLLHIGSGKDYRPGWLNVDIQESAQPDITLDLSKAQSWPATIQSPFWGAVQLQAGASELIYASNVLEHVSDLPTFMGNCLSLLRAGGVMVIEVPYEASLGAWQDPTHVRAMNENSWIYYTDWFWYLGWFEYRFKVRDFHWLDAQLARCEKADAAFMNITLEKTQTSVAERMTARTMRPDFGGLLAPALPATAPSGAIPAATAPQRAAIPVHAQPAGPPNSLPAAANQQDTPPLPAGRPIPPGGPPALQPSRAGAPRSGSPRTHNIASDSGSGNQIAVAEPRPVQVRDAIAQRDPHDAKLLAHLPEARSVIEFGCGRGELGEQYKNRFPNARWTGVDSSEEALSVASRRLDAVICESLDEALPKFPTEKYDLVVFDSMLERVDRPEVFLAQIHELCHENSRLVCSVPNMSHLSVMERFLIGDISYDGAGLLDEANARLLSPSSAIKLFLDGGWLPKMVDSHAFTPESPALQHLIRAAQALGCPTETALRTLSLRQMIFECRRARRAPVTARTRARFSVVVPVSNPLQAELNVKRSPGLQEIGCEVIFVTDAPDASAAFEEGAAKATNDWILYCHQDIYIPRSSGHQLNQLIDRLEVSGNPDAFVGFAGVSLESEAGPQYCGLCNDRLGLFDYPASISGVSVDECAVLIRKNSRYRIDPALGWHLWATDLCLQSIFSSGRAAEVVRIPIFHNSFNDGILSESFRQSARVLKAKYPHQKKIPTIAAGVIS